MEKKFIYIILGLVSVLYLLTLNSYLSINGDNATYLTLAESIYTGQGYADINSPGNPPHVLYPPFFPVLISLLTSVGVTSILGVKVFVVLLGISSVYLIYVFFKRKPQNEILVASTLLVGFSPYLFSYSHAILSEAPYLFFSILALIFTEKYQRDERLFSGNLIACILFISSAALTRAIGLSLFAGCMTYFLLGENGEASVVRLKKFAMVGVPSSLVLGTWILRNFLVKQANSVNYISGNFLKDPYAPSSGTIDFTAFVERVYHNVISYMYNVGKVIFPVYDRSFSHFPETELVPRLIALSVSGVVLVAFVHGLKEKRLSEYYVFFYMMIISVHIFESIRFLVPIVPFICYYLIRGFTLILSALKKNFLSQRVYHQAFATCIVLLLSISIIEDVIYVKNQNSEGFYSANAGQGWQDYYEMAKWAEVNSTSANVFLCRKPYLFYIWSKRKTQIFPYTEDRNKIVSCIIDNKVDFVVVDSIKGLDQTKKYLVPALSEISTLELVYRKNGSKVYKLNRQSEIEK